MGSSKGPKRQKSLGRIQPTRLVTGYGRTAGRLWTNFLTALISCPEILLFSGKQFETDADVKQAVTFWLQTLDNYLFYGRIQALVPLCDKCFVVSGDNVETDVYHLPSM
jgi:hypothetical protein